MKRLENIVMHGSRQGKATGYQFWPGFIVAHFSDGTTKYMGDISHDKALADLKEQGHSTADYEKLLAEAEKARSYPPKPETVTEYLNNWSYEVPAWLGEWQWSATFGRWGRIVRFANNWEGLTWPRVF